jgi:hypothetical protein
MKPVAIKFMCILSALLVLMCRVYAQDVSEKNLFGIKLSKPENWIEMNNTELQNNLSKIKFNEEEQQKILNSNNGILTLSTYYKYKIDSVAGLIPTIKTTVRTNPTTNMSDFKQVILASIDRIKTVVKNFEFIENSKEVTVSGFPSLYNSFRYSLTLANGDNINVRTRYYMIPKGAVFISISLMDNETNDDCTKAFDNFINSLQLKK